MRIRRFIRLRHKYPVASESLSWLWKVAQLAYDGSSVAEGYALQGEAVQAAKARHEETAVVKYGG
jgi:hypothetical protein